MTGPHLGVHPETGLRAFIAFNGARKRNDYWDYGFEDLLLRQAACRALCLSGFHSSIEMPHYLRIGGDYFGWLYRYCDGLQYVTAVEDLCQMLSRRRFRFATFTNRPVVFSASHSALAWRVKYSGGIPLSSGTSSSLARSEFR